MTYTVRLSHAKNLKQELLALKKAGIYPAFEKKLTGVLAVSPLSGKPLRHQLKGFYRYKLLGDWRIIYHVDVGLKEVTILSVDNRKSIYEDPDDVLKRFEAF